MHHDRQGQVVCSLKALFFEPPFRGEVTNYLRLANAGPETIQFRVHQPQGIDHLVITPSQGTVVARAEGGLRVMVSPANTTAHQARNISPDQMRAIINNPEHEPHPYVFRLEWKIARKNEHKTHMIDIPMFFAPPPPDIPHHISRDGQQANTVVAGWQDAHPHHHPHHPHSHSVGSDHSFQSQSTSAANQIPLEAFLAADKVDPQQANSSEYAQQLTSHLASMDAQHSNIKEQIKAAQLELEEQQRQQKELGFRLHPHLERETRGRMELDMLQNRKEATESRLRAEFGEEKRKAEQILFENKMLNQEIQVARNRRAQLRMENEVQAREARMLRANLQDRIAMLENELHRGRSCEFF